MVFGDIFITKGASLPKGASKINFWIGWPKSYLDKKTVLGGQKAAFMCQKPAFGYQKSAFCHRKVGFRQYNQLIQR